MAKTWTDITSGRVAAGAGLTTGLVTDLRDNDEANSVKPIFLPLDETKASAPAAYPGTADATYYMYLPEDGAVFRARGALWTSAGTGYCKLRIERASAPAGYVEQEQSTTATSKGAPAGTADKTWTLSGLESVSGQDLRGQLCKVTAWFKHSASGTVNLESVGWPASYSAVS